MLFIDLLSPQFAIANCDYDLLSEFRASALVSDNRVSERRFLRVSEA
jgi:hypothetical protein